MTRGAAILVVDLLAGALLAALVATGAIIQFALPPGSNRTSVLWGLSRHDIGRAHAIISAGLVAAIVVHVALHWRWLVTALWKRTRWPDLPARREQGLRALAHTVALAVPAVPVVGIIIAASMSVRDRSSPRHAAAPSAGGLAPSDTPGATLAGVAFAADRVLALRCARCHGAESPDAGVRADVTAGIAANAAADLLAPLEAATSNQHPHKHRLPGEELRVLRAWAASVADGPPSP